MRQTRRTFLTTLLSALGALSASSMAGLLFSRPLQAANAANWPQLHFQPMSYLDALKQITSDRPVIESQDIMLTVPKVAENGASVPLTIESSLENVQKVFVLVEHNPTPLAAEFTLAADALLFITARIKMAQTSNVVVLVDNGQRFLRVVQATVEVTVGGCGG